MKLHICRVYIVVQMLQNPSRSIAIDNGLIGEDHHPDFDFISVEPTPYSPSVIGDRICTSGSNGADVVFLLDSSSSVGDDFPKMQSFVKNVASGFTIGPSDVQVGVATYTGEPRSEFQLNANPDITSIFRAVDLIPYDDGKTNTGTAIQFVLDNELTEDSGLRPDAEKIVVVITDGSSQDEVVGPAAAAVAANVDLFAVAITPDVNDEELMQIVNFKPNRIFKVDRFEDLQQTIRNKLVDVVCEATGGTATDYVPPPIATMPPPTNPPSGGTPQLECASDMVTLTAATRNPFEGRIFVKGYSADPSCSTTGAGSPGSTTDITFSVPFDACGMMRTRPVCCKGGQPGVQYETTIIVSFHPQFLTKVDRAFKVRCFYMEADKTVSSAVDVSMITTDMLSAQAPMPVCTYSIHADSPDGPPASYVNLGQKIYHVWHCDADAPHEIRCNLTLRDRLEDPTMYRLLVHSCEVADGRGQGALLLDSSGCMTDKYLLQNLIYDSNVPLAYQETHAFKFADNNALNFRCAITLCLTQEPECGQITVGGCNAARSRPFYVLTAVQPNYLNVKTGGLGLDLCGNCSVGPERRCEG